MGCTSPTEITAKAADFMYKTPNRLFDTERFVPSREQHKRLSQKGSETCQLATMHRSKPRGIRSMKKGNKLSQTRQAMASQLEAIESQLQEMEHPKGSQSVMGTTMGGVF